MSDCYGETNSGGRCERPAGHYPALHHLSPLARSFMEWTDEAMADFKRIADDPSFPKQVEQERQRYDRRQALIATVRTAIHAELQRQTTDDGDMYVEITPDIWLLDGGIDLQVLAMAVVDRLPQE
jgi:hypothetical protein